ncbi:MAG: hypothetical protein SF029_05585 [bacterium]|nr:hypothetical protein [bacterium]
MLRTLVYVGWLLLAAFVLAACEGEATPLAAEIPPTPTPTQLPVTPQPIRYALGMNTLNAVAELSLLESAAQVEQLTAPASAADLGTRFDLIAQYGQQAGWTPSEITPQVALVIDRLENPVLMDVLRGAVDAQAIVEMLNIPGMVARPTTPLNPADLRAQLANQGRPDGFGLVIGHTFVLGVEQVTRQLETINIETRTVALSEAALLNALEEGSVQAGLFIWTSDDQRAAWQTAFGAENVIDLYSLPISYLAREGLRITFSPGGWPLVEQ